MVSILSMHFIQTLLSKFICLDGKISIQDLWGASAACRSPGLDGHTPGITPEFWLFTLWTHSSGCSRDILLFANSVLAVSAEHLFELELFQCFHHPGRGLLPLLAVLLEVDPWSLLAIAVVDPGLFPPYLRSPFCAAKPQASLGQSCLENQKDFSFELALRICSHGLSFKCDLAL